MNRIAKTKLEIEANKSINWHKQAHYLQQCPGEKRVGKQPVQRTWEVVNQKGDRTALKANQHFWV